MIEQGYDTLWVTLRENRVARITARLFVYIQMIIKGEVRNLFPEFLANDAMIDCG